MDKKERESTNFREALAILPTLKLEEIRRLGDLCRARASALGLERELKDPMNRGGYWPALKES